MSATDQFRAIQTILKEAGVYSGELDGVPGSKSDAGYNIVRTLAVREFRANRAEAPVPAPSNAPTDSGISQSAIDLILESEGIDQPSRWPGGESGITLGYGVDIGADPESLDYWKDELTPDQMDELKAAKGVTGERAHSIAGRFSDINVTKEMALRVFNRFTLPIEVAKTKAAFPGADQLPPPALGALVSLVFNRGTSLKGGRRVEMAEIHDILADGIQKGDLQEIADKFREMKKLWAGQGLDGLITRREAEARLVESCIV